MAHDNRATPTAAVRPVHAGLPVSSGPCSGRERSGSGCMAPAHPAQRRVGHGLLPALALALALSLAFVRVAPLGAQGLPGAGRPTEGVTTANLPNYRSIVQRAAPAVVGITVTGLQSLTIEDWLPGAAGAEQAPQNGVSTPRHFRSQASGFLITADGLILTSAHVVQGADDIVVRLRDRREFKAEVLGTDPLTDVAVLRVPGTGLPVVHLGRGDELQVGDLVLAIGAPFGLEQTATQGIVSAKGRSLPVDSLVAFIQTDAAVNPGNSGGPLLDATGAAVGINAQIYSSTGGYQGLSFAIPIEVALRVKDQILAHGEVRHARMGVEIQDLDQPLARAFGMEAPTGALVVHVAAGSPAALGGLQPGDVIAAYNGQRIDNTGDLSRQLVLATPGDRVRLGIWRERAERAVSLRLDGVTREAPEKPGPAGAPPRQLGLTLRALTGEERQAHAINGAGGLMVQHSEGLAAREGVQSGDLLLAVNGTPAMTAEQVASLLAGRRGVVALLIQRQQVRLFVPVELGQ